MAEVCQWGKGFGVVADDVDDVEVLLLPDLDVGKEAEFEGADVVDDVPIFTPFSGVKNMIILFFCREGEWGDVVTHFCQKCKKPSFFTIPTHFGTLFAYFTAEYIFNT